MNVTLSFALQYIQKLDDLHETLQLQGILFTEWTDERLVWIPEAYNNTKVVYAAADTVWRPELVVANPSKTLQFLGDEISRLLTKHSYNGVAQWSVADVFHCTCSVDLTSFPWDIQTCTLEFTVWAYKVHEIQLIAWPAIIDLNQFETNGQWILLSKRVYTKYHPVKSVLAFEFVLKRRPLFFVVNILLPIVSFSVLNLAVFIIPIDSGERISFSLTLLLSIGVFLTLISANLPPNAETMASICYFLFFVMVQSTVICLLNIISIKLYFKANDESAPNKAWNRCFMLCNTIKCCFQKKITTGKEETPEDASDQTDDACMNHSEFNDKTQRSCSWKDISKMADQTFLVVMIIFLVFAFSMFTFHAYNGI
ncbi:neuronal acetylcholine receptor subunit alpha-5-like [Mercenaria mercenaria]|uniref:neuronal acetylcholine receptor subunit alpha-5-like n=1 Tax=Mercenaria mercenaria TaxID=6596 RepID=UPI00234F3DEE|nr:neuronal acetylcholine receptor subunit alpha-5-like [Mercenaria mercenaria]XP_053397818.1 neuronal acetylcholine receptor subunit alpha-5-like [Mercenaria mercenaria]